MNYDLPKKVKIDGLDYEIRYDYRVVLEIFEAINDPNLNDQERAIVVLQMFYLDFDRLTNYEAAISECLKFINGGEEDSTKKKNPQLVDWAMDFPRIVAPVNRVLGYEIRSKEYDAETNTGGVHWWTVLAAYMEIGDCLFAQIVNIRSKKARGKKLDKSEQEFYRRNRDIVDIKPHYTEEEDDLIKVWMGK